MNTEIIGQIILQLVLIAVNAIFACTEIAVISVNDARLSKLAAEGNKKAIRLAKLKNKPARFLSTIQVAITLSGFLASAFASQNFADLLMIPLKKLNIPISDSVLNTICVVLITIILSYITLVFGELVPKRVAMKKAESVALGISGLISFASTIFAPIVWLLTISTNGVLRLMGIDPNADDEEVTEQDIRMMVDVGSEKGVIDNSEKEMIQNVFEFDDLTIDKFLTHRTDIVYLYEEDDVDVWHETICENPHACYPICGETVDDVTGILYANDYFRLKDRSTKEAVLEGAVRSPYFVPETLRADVLFEQMKKTGNYFAVALDEYGGMSGIVTLTNLIEQIVGDFPDEDPEDGEPVEEEEIKKLDTNRFRILGSAELDEVSEVIGVKLPSDEFDTFGGYVFGIYGTVPDDGTTISLDTDDLHIEVLKINEHRAEINEVTVLEKVAVEEQA